MDDCLALRIAAVFVLAIFSFLGVLLPLAVSEEQRKSDIFIIIKTGAAGVMLGLCLVGSTILPWTIQPSFSLPLSYQIHLMPDADEQLAELVPEYPLSYALTCLGVVLVLGIEQITLAWAAKNRESAHHRGHKHPHHDHPDLTAEARSFFGLDEHDVVPAETTVISTLHQPLTIAERDENRGLLESTSSHSDYQSTGTHNHGHDHSGSSSKDDGCDGHGHGHQHDQEEPVSMGHDHGHEHTAHEEDAGGCDGHDHGHGHDHHATMITDAHDHGHGHGHRSPEPVIASVTPATTQLRHRHPIGVHGHNHSHGHAHGHKHGNSHKHGKVTHEKADRFHSKNDFDISNAALANGHDHDHGALALDDLMQANNMRDLMTAYALEISTAIHSLIIGVDLGMQTSYTSAAILLAALSFHQFVEGLGLGTVIASSTGALGNSKVLSFVIIFTCTVSVGVMIGILTSSDDESNLQIAITGCATSIAAGSLMYTALTEMAGGTFNRPDLEDRLGLKIWMVISFLTGIVIMSIIGIWA